MPRGNLGPKKPEGCRAATLGLVAHFCHMDILKNCSHIITNINLHTWSSGIYGVFYIFRRVFIINRTQILSCVIMVYIHTEFSAAIYINFMVSSIVRVFLYFSQEIGLFFCIQPLLLSLMRSCYISEQSETCKQFSNDPPIV